MNTKIVLPGNLLEGDSPRTERLNVQVDSPGFGDGRQFRTYKRLNIASGATYVIKAVLLKDIELYDQTISLTDGSLDFRIVLGGTASGTFSEALPVIPKNQRTGVPAPAAGMTLTAGGQVTGGVERESLLIKTASAGGQAFTVASLVRDKRGLPAGAVFYLLFLNTGISTLTGTWSAWAEQFG